MSVTLAFVLGFVAYALGVVGMYVPAIKDHPWYIPGSMLFALSTSFLWPWIVQNTSDQDQLYLRGIVWDAMLIGTYSVLPFIFGVRLTGMAMVGVAVTLVGILIIKLN